MGMDDFSTPNQPPTPPTYDYNPQVQTSMSTTQASSTAIAMSSSSSAYPDPDLNGHPMHISPYSPPPSIRPLQPYSMPPQQQQQHSPSHEPYSPAQSQQQYSYDIQLRYPAPSPSLPIPSMSNRFEPPRDQHAALPPMSMMQGGNSYQNGGAMDMVDTTGQMPPPGVKPRLTATLWEDEGTLCFQVDVKGICVARREDNHMINGTKLLNVVGMTRGRRDGILKSEKQKHVVKIGPMHLKGVWIPYERALEFANKEHITALLYPLFVHNIGSLLHHPVNHHPMSHHPSSNHPSSHHPSSHLPSYRHSASSLPSNMYPPTPTSQYPPTPGQNSNAQYPPPLSPSAQIPRSHEFSHPLPSLQPMSPDGYGGDGGGYGREQERGQVNGQAGLGGQYQSEQGGVPRYS